MSTSILREASSIDAREVEDADRDARPQSLEPAFGSSVTGEGSSHGSTLAPASHPRVSDATLFMLRYVQTEELALSCHPSEAPRASNAASSPKNYRLPLPCAALRCSRPRRHMARASPPENPPSLSAPPRTRKKLLLLDLDQTLIHSKERPWAGVPSEAVSSLVHGLLRESHDT